VTIGSIGGTATEHGAEPPTALRDARRRLLVEGSGISLTAAAFGLVFGLAAKDAGLSIPEAIAMSLFVFAGAAQFAAVGMIAQGVPWAAIVLLTALLNSRHLLYSAALLPWLRPRPAPERAAMAYVLTDEAFALSLHHFNRLGRTDVRGYWLAAGLVWVPWNLATIAGVVGGQAIPDPARFGIDVVFPAAMAGLAVLLIRARRDLVAAIAACAVGVVLALAVDPAVGIVAGGLIGPLVALAVVRPHDGDGGVAAKVDAEAEAQAFGFTRPASHDDDASIGSAT
jgi:predicted branched-subunit amino acid permease